MVHAQSQLRQLPHRILGALSSRKRVDPVHILYKAVLLVALNNYIDSRLVDELDLCLLRRRRYFFIFTDSSFLCAVYYALYVVFYFISATFITS